jgi:hypothetical protein
MRSPMRSIVSSVAVIIMSEPERIGNMAEALWKKTEQTSKRKCGLT